jgi:hypothetical protein
MMSFKKLRYSQNNAGMLGLRRARSYGQQGIRSMIDARKIFVREPICKTSVGISWSVSEDIIKIKHKEIGWEIFFWNGLIWPRVQLAPRYLENDNNIWVSNKVGNLFCRKATLINAFRERTLLTTYIHCGERCSIVD